MAELSQSRSGKEAIGEVHQANGEGGTGFFAHGIL